MKKPVKFLLCLAILIGFVFAANSQNIRITGKVTAPDGTEIAGVHIFDSIAKVGATSNKNGVFSLTLPQKATKLRFSHVAFETKYLPLTAKRLADTIAAKTIWLDVVLTQKVRELAVAEISDAKVQIAYKNRKQWILDYEPVGEDEFLLLLLERGKKYLQLVNSNHEKISQIRVDKDFKELYKDCFGFFHLLNKDSACQVFLVDEELALDYYSIRHDFDRMIAPIVANTENYLYTKNYATVNDQLVSYYQINKEAKEKTLFVQVFDEKQAIYNSTYVSKIMGGFIGCCMENNIEITPELINAFRSILINSKNVNEYWRSRYKLGSAGMCVPLDPKKGLFSFYKQVLSTPPYSLLSKINNKIYFFDHLNNIITTYDLDGNYLKEVPINYHNNKGWDKEIIVNEEKTRCFTKFTRNGETSLVEINPDNGQTLRTYVLEVHAFPTKIKVRGNEIYYMSKGYFEGEQQYFLWKQKME